MLVNIIVLALIIFWAAFVIRWALKSLKKAKKSGVPAACAGCESYKKGNCSSHCMSKDDVDKMVAEAQKNLAAKNQCGGAL